WKRPGRIDSCRLNKETIPFGMVSLFYVEKYLSEQALGPFAVSCSSGAFHTRQFASKLSVADVYESRHNKAAHKVKESERKLICLLFCEGQLVRRKNALELLPV
ncbi:MAG: hypothetical protein ACRC8T_00380, partial [Acidaminococcaceae bacterium]